MTSRFKGFGAFGSKRTSSGNNNNNNSNTSTRNGLTPPPPQGGLQQGNYSSTSLAPSPPLTALSIPHTAAPLPLLVSPCRIRLDLEDLQAIRIIPTLPEPPALSHPPRWVVTRHRSTRAAIHKDTLRCKEEEDSHPDMEEDMDIMRLHNPWPSMEGEVKQSRLRGPAGVKRS